MEDSYLSLTSKTVKKWKIIYWSVYVVIIVVVLILQSANHNFTKNEIHDCFLIPTVITSFVVSWLLNRLSHLIDEWPLKHRLHEGSLYKLLSFVFANFHKYCLLQMVACFMFYLFSDDGIHFTTCLWNQVHFILLSALIFSFIKNPENIELSIIMENNNLNIGQGLAEAYYYNYLKLLQAYPGSCLVDRIEEFEHKHKVSRVLKNLIILLPKSCYIPKNLEESNTDGYPKLERSRELPTLYINIGGIEKRPYNNTVYGILRDNKTSPERCVVEGATPLKTLYDMSQSAASGLTEAQRLEQLKLFHYHLNMLLERDPECCNSFILFFYNDRDENGSSVSLSRLLLEKIDEIKYQRAL